MKINVLFLINKSTLKPMCQRAGVGAGQPPPLVGQTGKNCDPESTATGHNPSLCGVVGLGSGIGGSGFSAGSISGMEPSKRFGTDPTLSKQRVGGGVWEWVATRFSRGRTFLVVDLKLHGGRNSWKLLNGSFPLIPSTPPRPTDGSYALEVSLAQPLSHTPAPFS